ncbi:DNA primase/helicase [Pectobacterium phage Wc4-1]|uniref:DNA primase/helicase n=2 Tax=Arnovirus TaxID=3425109 RepID=A0A5P8D489_9CAUD|nr:hypothetical protein Arno18_116 [Pectobacterium phage Arno18]QFP93835.1 DNA primase/helicase [Pectobacterium phage Wc4]QFP93980.1 DNA primase/helicase [Pectobacterium phage Wc4-1]
MARKLKERGVFIGHTACPKCGASDAGALYKHDDGSHSFSCFSTGCGKSVLNADPTKFELVDEATYNNGEKKDITNRIFRGMDLAYVKENLDSMDLRDRRLAEGTLKRYGVKVDVDDAGDISAHFYPTYKTVEGLLNHTGYRVRHKFPDDYKKENLRGKLKDFRGGVGDISGELAMFGSWLYPEGGKRLLIFEGEIDCMTAAYMISLKVTPDRRKNYACVSVPSGANIKGIKDNFQWINSFEEIYLCFDNDEAGHKLQMEVAGILPTHKVKLFALPEGTKDINEWWVDNYGSKEVRQKTLDAFMNRLYNATPYCPAGIRNFADGYEAMKNRGQATLIPFPESFGDLNQLTFGGYGLAEITTIVAASSVGKSALTREMMHTAWMRTEYNIGVIPLEDTYEELMEMLCAVHLSQQINEIPYDERNWDEIKAAHTELSKGRRINIVDHQGAITQENLLDFVDYLIGALGCKILFIDPISLAVQGADTDADEVLSEILRRCKRHKVAVVHVCHVRKNSGSQKANSEGGELSEEDIKGTGGFFQISMNNIIATRNKVDPDPVKKNITKLKLSKCRRHGKSTGIAGYVWYNGDTGRLIKAAGHTADIDQATENIRQQFGIDEEEADSSIPPQYQEGEMLGEGSGFQTE